MPGRMVNGTCLFVPLGVEYTTTIHSGTYQSSSHVDNSLDFGELTSTDQATFRNCFTFGNYYHRFFYKPVWPMVTVYQGEIIVGSAFWFDRGFIIVDEKVIPVKHFKIFCSERP